MQMKTRVSPFVVLCLMGGLAIFSSTMAKNPALPLFLCSLGVDIPTIGLIATASTVVGIVVSLPAGILSDIVGRRRMILISAVIFATAPFLYLPVTLPWQLVLVRIYHGLATAILGPVAMAAVADTFKTNRGDRMGWYSSATMVGRFLAPLIGGLLIFGNDFRWVYIADGFAGILVLLAALRLPLTSNTASSGQDSFQHRKDLYKQEISFVFRHRGILATSSIEAVQYFAFGSIETFLPVYLNKILGFQAWEIGILFTVQILVAAITKPMMGRLSDRYGRIPLIAAGLALGGIATATLLLISNYFVIMGIIALFGLSLATVTVSTSALVADYSRSQSHGSALGILSSIMDIGHAGGPIIAGILIGAVSYQTTFALVGAGLVIAGLIYSLAMRYLNYSVKDATV